ncbi:hypothetical protein DL764_004493 [Monosporascus ibericus]|uniref:F-box domain-containing protein n=1 Tax=Monosporascus ibericus TaxID=155417 RepID=A0A4V1XAY8_9PEZI|nr:hypothetical protein DL764_004493 [Monosporascus ibericus]
MMPDAHDAGRPVRPPLPRLAKLPKPSPHISHPLHSPAPVTRATTSAGTIDTSPPAPTHLSSSVLRRRFTSSDDKAPRHPPRRPHKNPVLPPLTRKRKTRPKPDLKTANKRPLRSSRTSATKISYLESDAEDDGDDFVDADFKGNPGQGVGAVLEKLSNTSRSKLAYRHRISFAAKKVKTSDVAASVNKKIKKSENVKDYSYVGAELPYHVWKRVFEHIATPLCDPDARLEDVVLAMRELLAVGRLGRLVYEPAVAALYKCPPILDPFAFRLLSRTLSQPPNTTLVNYRPKVKILRIDVGHILHLKYGGCYLRLDDMVPYLPNLLDLELYHYLDSAPYRALEDTIRYKYPSNLLQILGLSPQPDDSQGDKITPIQLRGWKWNARLAGHILPLGGLEAIHRSPSFASLRKVAFVNYQLPSMASKSASAQISEERDACAIKDLAAAIAALPYLRHLTLESSTLADSNLLRLLPKSLKHLELINCWEVTADGLADFLLTHGNSLERLTLNHCISLSLGFLRVLKGSCPNLTHLHMNLLYYKTHEHYHDDDPLYDHILENGEVPTWPASIRSIDIDYMRFDSISTAEMLFRSLVSSAPELPNLRRLVLGAKMNVSLRERIEFRKTWEEKMTAIFRRKMEPPVSILGQQAEDMDPLGQEEEKREHPRQGTRVKRLRNVKASKIPTRRSTRLADNSPSKGLKESGDSDLADTIDTKTPRLAAQLQWSIRDVPVPKHHDADDEKSEESEDELAAALQGSLQPNGRKATRVAAKILRDKGEDVDFVHGLCDVVQVEIDNQKPTEQKYSMDDFRDLPLTDESDGEWNGDRSDEEDSIA